MQNRNKIGYHSTQFFAAFNILKIFRSAMYEPLISSTRLNSSSRANSLGGQDLLDITTEKLAVKLIANCVIDETPGLFFWLSSLILEYHIIIPPSLHCKIATRYSDPRGVQKWVALQDGTVTLLGFCLSSFTLLPLRLKGSFFF
mmetsp:Transcript_70069/g.116363  ORF Transcript_70069/g.116363 Transcript_70069/m.116363 type:complete len:144 (-) Transcript_70069:475-906(-)